MEHHDHLTFDLLDRYIFSTFIQHHFIHGDNCGIVLSKLGFQVWTWTLTFDHLILISSSSSQNKYLCHTSSGHSWHITFTRTWGHCYPELWPLHKHRISSSWSLTEYLFVLNLKKFPQGITGISCAWAWNNRKQPEHEEKSLHLKLFLFLFVPILSCSSQKNASISIQLW